MAEAPVTPRVEHDGSGGFAQVRGVHETNDKRDLNLEIEPRGEHFHLRIQTADPDLQAAFGDDLEHELPLTREELWGHVQACREVWRREVVDRRTGGGHPFQDRWDHAGSPELLAEVLPKVALAGWDLFVAIFHPTTPAADTQELETLRRIGRILSEKMSERRRWLRISSDSFFVPWSLLYSDPLDLDGSDARPEGFWGYQHLIEHAPSAGRLGWELEAPDGRLEVGLHLDEGIDEALGVECIAPVVRLLESYSEEALVTYSRPTKRRLAEALRKVPCDQVLFFCCHAEQEGDFTGFRIDDSYLRLSDADSPQNRIRPREIVRWMNLRFLPHHPLVFLNACGSGQLNSVFYAGFGRAFLGLRASSVIGAQTELPAVFAGELARRFLAAFFRGGPDNKIGRVLYKLRRELLDAHNNPLGLIYSLYRGADSHLPRAVPEKDAADG